MPLFTFQTRRPLPETAQEMQARIKYLFTIRDELDKELEMLMGRRDTFEAARPWHCIRCGYEWRSRLPHRPKLCPKCKAKKFDTPPLYTYEERMARKATNGKLPLAPLAHSVITRQVYVEDPVPRVSLENDSIQNVMLTPPPAPGTIHPVPMSLRDRLAQMKTIPPVIEQPAPTPEPEPVIIESAEELVIESAVATEEDLLDVINGESDAT